jgi:alanyl-tRNA synthetase
VQGRRSTYETDLFQPILDRVQDLLGHDEAERDRNLVGYRVLADHGRAMTFLIADGVSPGNDGRNYVLRLIMRRAMRFGRQIGFRAPFLAELAGAAVDTMALAYPDLAQKHSWIQEVVVEEEARFARTLESGLELLDGVIAGVLSSGAGEIDGRDVFRLYDTFGFPPDLTRQVAEEHGLSIDRAGFEAAMQAQRERARADGRFASEELGQVLRRLELPQVVFTGYAELDSEAHVMALVMNGESVASAPVEADVHVILDTTPFYAEAGGQVGDTGALTGSHGAARVLDTQRPIAGITVHAAHVEAGELRVGDPIRATVDGERRGDIMRNHTATHLLHAALQAVLGGHAQQRGSLVAPDRLRFDFAHLKALSHEEMADIEARVQAWVRADARVSTKVMPLDEARHAGATMLFGEKYGDDVRVLTVEGTSMELCGGTHVSATGQIGTFVIQSEGSVGSGLRRIEALTGRGGDAFVRERLELLGRVAGALGTSDPSQIPDRIADLEGRAKELERNVERLESLLAAQEAEGLVPLVKTVAGVPAVAVRVDAISAEVLRSRADAARQELGSALIVLGAIVDGAPRFVAAVTDDLTKSGWHAGELVKAMAELVGGRGGGRPHLAEAGGGDPDGLDRALAQFDDVVVQLAARDVVRS